MDRYIIIQADRLIIGYIDVVSINSIPLDESFMCGAGDQWRRKTLSVLKASEDTYMTIPISLFDPFHHYKF